MIKSTFNLEFITPCFCAGAVPAVAEIRAPSIRGKLRWWFRVLGGSREEEAEVFGSTAGEIGNASAVIVRVAEMKVRTMWQPILFNDCSNEGYLLYFAKASGGGARWVTGGAIPRGANFQLQVLWKRSISAGAKTLFDLSLEAFLVLGALGLRSTRGLGCFETKEKPFSEAALQTILAAIHKRSPDFRTEFGEFRGPQANLIEALGAQLRGLRSGLPSRRPSPLGSSQPRQASAIHLRPVKTGPDAYRLIVFEAPADKVLAADSRIRLPRTPGVLPPPQGPRQRPGGGRR